MLNQQLCSLFFIFIYLSDVSQHLAKIKLSAWILLFVVIFLGMLINFIAFFINGAKSKQPFAKPEIGSRSSAVTNKLHSCTTLNVHK